MSREQISSYPHVTPISGPKNMVARMVDGVFRIFSFEDDNSELQEEDYPYPDRDTFVKDLNELLAITAHGTALDMILHEQKKSKDLVGFSLEISIVVMIGFYGR